MMDAETREALETFIEETRERVGVMDEILSGLLSAQRGRVAESVQRLFREAHSLKGSANLLGLADVGRLVHHLEDVLDMFWKGMLQPEEQSIQVLRDALEFLNRLVDNVRIIKLVDVSPQIQRLSTLVHRLQNPGDPL